MEVFKRLAIIFSTIAITSFASHHVDKKVRYTKDSEKFFKAGKKLYTEGCGEQVHKGFLINPSKCLAAYARLKKAVSYNGSLYEANYLLSILYYYQPSQLNWNKKLSLKFYNTGLSHAYKALEYAPDHQEVKEIVQLYIMSSRKPTSLKSRKKSSIQ